MSDEIDIKIPSWLEYKLACPNCGQEFKQVLQSDESPTLYRHIDTEDSELGTREVVYCNNCNTTIQHHYPDSEVSAQEDPLVNPDLWVIRAQSLQNNTSLKRRESQVRALKESGKTHSEIAEELGISESTVGEYSRRIKDREERSAKSLQEFGYNTDLSDVLAGQLEGFPLTPASSWPCGNCGNEISHGDRARAVLEKLTSGWQGIDFYCEDCKSGEKSHHVHGKEIPIDEFVQEDREGGMTCVILDADIVPYEEVNVTQPGQRHSKDSMSLQNVEVVSLLPKIRSD